MIDDKDMALYEVLLAVVRSLVDRPDDVQIEPVSSGVTVTFQVTAHPTDVGKLIGANGRTARALRTIVGANAARLKRSFGLDIIQNQGPVEVGAARYDGSSA